MNIDPNEFRQRLAAELAQLDETLLQADASARTVALDQSSVGRLTRMDAMQQQAMAQGMALRLRTRKRALLAALDRIVAGSYGICCSCESGIDPDRLLSDAAAVFCVACIKERAEQGGA